MYVRQPLTQSATPKPRPSKIGKTHLAPAQYSTASTEAGFDMKIPLLLSHVTGLLP